MEIDITKGIIEQIGESYFYDNEKMIKIVDFVNEQEEINKEQLSQLDSYKNFCRFASCLLIRNQSGTYKEKGINYYKSDDLEEKLNALDINDNKWNDEKFLKRIVKESKINYERFNESSGEILIQAKEIFNENYNRNFSIYINEANSYFEKFKDKPLPKRYFLDQFIGINGIGYKTRDLGLSTLITNVISIDRHLMRIPYHLKINKTSTISEKKWKEKSPGSKKYYFEFAKFLLDLSHQIGITPYRFDRLLWKFATEVCTKNNPRCENCAVKKCEKRNVKLNTKKEKGVR